VDGKLDEQKLSDVAFVTCYLVAADIANTAYGEFEAIDALAAFSRLVQIPMDMLVQIAHAVEKEPV